jgi:ketosteroid isomerase-like protein
MRVTAIATGVALAVFACRAAPTPDSTAAARAAIDADNAAWARLTAAGHADSIAAFYHSAAVLLPPNMLPLRGHDSIRAFFAFMNTMSSPPPTLAIRAESVWGSGPQATELGRWTFTWPAGAQRPAGAPAVDSGKYLARWVWEDGQWLMAQHIWNSDLPVAAPAP